MRLIDLLTPEQIAAADGQRKPAQPESHKELVATYGPLIRNVAARITPNQTAKVSAAMLIAFTMIDDALQALPERPERRKTDIVRAPCECASEKGCDHEPLKCRRRGTFQVQERDDTSALCGDCASQTTAGL